MGNAHNRDDDEMRNWKKQKFFAFVDLIVSKSKIKMNTEFETLFNGFVLGLTKKLKKNRVFESNMRK